jgi:hypothetical protein
MLADGHLSAVWITTRQLRRLAQCVSAASGKTDGNGQQPAHQSVYRSCDHPSVLMHDLNLDLVLP